MNKLIILSFLILTACGKSGSNQVQTFQHEITFNFEPTGATASSVGVLWYEIDANTMFTNVYMDDDLTALEVSLIDINDCLLNQNIDVAMHLNQGERFSIRFLRNNNIVSYNDVIGCSLYVDIKTRIRQ